MSDRTADIAPDEDRTLTSAERALANLRQAAFAALEAGASRQDIDREVAEASRIKLRGSYPLTL